MREIRHLAHRNPDCQEAQDALAVLSRVHRCGLRASGSMKKRRRLRSYLCKCVREILAKCADVAVLEEFTAKLGNAYEDLFRFVLDPRIPSTNNAAERGLREIVVHRKIRGSIRQRTRCGGSGTCSRVSRHGSSTASTISQRSQDTSRRRKHTWLALCHLFAQCVFQLQLLAHQLVQLLLFDVNLLFEFKVFRSSFFVQFFCDLTWQSILNM